MSTSWPQGHVVPSSYISGSGAFRLVPRRGRDACVAALSSSFFLLAPARSLSRCCLSPAAFFFFSSTALFLSSCFLFYPPPLSSFSSRFCSYDLSVANISTATFQSPQCIEATTRNDRVEEEQVWWKFGRPQIPANIIKPVIGALPFYSPSSFDPWCANPLGRPQHKPGKRPLAWLQPSIHPPQVG